MSGAKSGGAPAARPRRLPWAVFAAAAAVSLVLSPVTAVWAALIGGAGLCGASAAVFAARRAPGPVTAAFAGIAAGALPYLLAGVLL